MKELKYISRYVKRHGLQYILGIAALFAVDLMNVYIPRYTGEITDGLEAQTLDMDGVLGLILRILILGAIVALGRFFWRYFIFGAPLKRKCATTSSPIWRRCPCAITMNIKPGT